MRGRQPSMWHALTSSPSKANPTSILDSKSESEELPSTIMRRMVQGEEKLQEMCGGRKKRQASRILQIMTKFSSKTRLE